jgi:hypothetical protein
MKKRYEPIKKELEAILEPFKGDGLRASSSSSSSRGPRRQGQPLADHQADRRERPLRSSAPQQPRVRALLDDEEARFKKAPGTFRDSPVGGDVTDALDLARELAIRNAGTLAKERYERYLDELSEHLRNSQKILIDITAPSATSSTSRS